MKKKIQTKITEGKTFLKPGALFASEYDRSSLLTYGPGEEVEISEISDAEGLHFKVKLSDPGLSSAWRYGYEPHWDIKISIDNPIEVPKLSQRNNQLRPADACGPTSITSVLRYYGYERPGGFEQMEDDITRWIMDNYGPNTLLGVHPVLADVVSIFSKGELKDKFTTGGSLEMFKREIDLGRPSVLAGDFTYSGHILVGCGYKPTSARSADEITHVTVMDPYGRWGEIRGSYVNTNVDYYDYSIKAFSQAMGRNDGWWMHLIHKL